MAVVLDPKFGGLSARMQEAVAVVVVALLIAVVMWRARATLPRQLEAERDHATLTGIFGRYVPSQILSALVAARGALAPVQREATVLFADVAGFTKLTKRVGAVRTVEILNEYFDEVTRIIGAHGGVVTQFQGDGILATFRPAVGISRKKRDLDDPYRLQGWLRPGRGWACREPRPAGRQPHGGHYYRSRARG